MKLLNSVQNEVVMSNVGSVKEFTIKATAKSFSILASGLYANKIKAIIRELSCNAVDSHTAAGCADRPFDVHLPTALEPHFSVRDYGVGLSHDEVCKIFTTFFESTKTDSNDYVGALGLGSKSPFSYTDNFTVTAIKDGRKGIYTAFINEAGVPSIALMMEENTNEPAGVEVKFAVNDRYDFGKFQQEAQSVYQYFNLKPTVGGVSNFAIPERKYETKDIIPGVHSYDSNAYRKSRAIMGNIAYPIDVPNNALGDLKKLLDCGLELHFNIGELDFQASREGLSYIPQTIEAIRSKLEQVNLALTSVLAKDADAYTNAWEKSIYLRKKKSEPLWSNAVAQYVQNTGFKLYNPRGYGSAYEFEINVETLKNDYNLAIRSFSKGKSENSCRTQEVRYRSNYVKNATGNDVLVQTCHWEIPVSATTYFVKNDTKIGASERGKYHWRNTVQDEYSNVVFVLEPADRTKPAKFDEFLDSLSSPPEKQIMFASSLKEKPRAGGVGKNVSILALEQRTRPSSWRADRIYYAWAPTKFGDLDPKYTYYYIPLKGYELVSSKNKQMSPHNIVEHLKSAGIKELDVPVYGVRKGDIEAIKLQKNWINLEDHITNVLSNIPQSVVDGIVKKSIENESFMHFGNKLMEKLDDKNPIKILYSRYANVKEVKLNQHAVTMLSNIYTKDSKFDPSKDVAKVQKECENIYTRYPLMSCLNSYTSKTYIEPLAQYINMVDEKLGF